MKILIFAGGTGSIALQQGIASAIENTVVSRENLDIKVLVNAYDNGLSTGAVRKVFNGTILGPSDVRKNHTTRLAIENPSSPWLKFLDIRFSQPVEKARGFCMVAIDNLRANLLGANESISIALNNEVVDKTELLKEAVNVFFSTANSRKIDYDDFSLANIIYAGFAASNGYSLRKAATIMSTLMGIKDNVILNDDTSLMLGAISKSGRMIVDEGDIVSWGNENDPIVGTFFTNPVTGEASRPVLCGEAIEAIDEADLIIISSGTQWSSLIPTYESEGFIDAIRSTSAKVVMVMNRSPDKDAPGQSANDIINLLVNEKQYFKKNQINLVIDRGGDPLMSSVSDDIKSILASCTEFESVDSLNLYSSSKTKHNPRALAAAVFHSYYGNYLTSKHVVFDYDDTLVGRGNSFKTESQYNADVLSIFFGDTIENCSGLSNKISICTGNSIKAIRLPIHTVSAEFAIDSNADKQNKFIPVFADGGINMYGLKTYGVLTSAESESEDPIPRTTFIRCINDSALLTMSDLMSINDALHTRMMIPKIKVENRNNAMIAIKPIDEEYRPTLVNFLQTLKTINVIPNNIKIQATGRSTIELKKSSLTKELSINHIIETLGHSDITYVGDEFRPGGNDYVVRETGVKCLSVKSPVETALFVFCLRDLARISRGGTSGMLSHISTTFAGN